MHSHTKKFSVFDSMPHSIAVNLNEHAHEVIGNLL